MSDAKFIYFPIIEVSRNINNSKVEIKKVEIKIENANFDKQIIEEYWITIKEDDDTICMVKVNEDFLKELYYKLSTYFKMEK